MKVVANLPYNITSDALKRLLPMGDTISDLVLMVQVSLCWSFWLDCVGCLKIRYIFKLGFRG